MASVLILRGSSQAIPFLLVDTATGQTGQTGKTPTVTVCRPGAVAFVASLGTVTELGLGNYQYAPTAAETASAGNLILHLVEASSQTMDVANQVVGFDPTAPGFDATFIQSSVQASPSPSATVFGGASGLNGSSNTAYLNAVLVFTSGVNKGLSHRIGGYVASTQVLTLVNALPAAPSVGDSFLILGRIE